MIKLFRTVNKDRSGQQDEAVERADALGTRVAELTTNKVVCGVLLMLVTFPALAVVTVDTGPNFALIGLTKTFDVEAFDPSDVEQGQSDEWKAAWAKFKLMMATDQGSKLLHVQLQGKEV